MFVTPLFLGTKGLFCDFRPVRRSGVTGLLGKGGDKFVTIGMKKRNFVTFKSYNNHNMDFNITKIDRSM